MLKSSTLAFTALVAASLSAQQIALDWATEVVPANNRVKTASDGSVFTLGTGDNSAVIQHLSSSGTVLWTKTITAPTLYAIDMDVDGSDNIYIYVGFTTGQVDLDPGPNTTLVDPGKVYAKYNSNGQFQWGFSLENSTDLSEDYGGVSCDDVGNLYICGDLGQGVYDFDFGPAVNELTVGDFSTGSYMARYRPDGSLAWANIETYYGGFCSSRDIAAMRDGSSFYVVRSLDNGGPLSSQIDVDYGPGIYNVYTETQHILRYDSALQFMAEGSANYGDVRMCADAAGSAYLMAQAQAGAGFQAVKFNQAGQAMELVYSTPLQVSGNLRLGDIAPDEQGGCLGMYSNNGPGGVLRFYKMNVSGLVDFNLTIPCGNDYTLPGGKGFDLDGGALYFGTYNQNYTVDFDPGPGVLNLPATSTNDGVVARFDWCQGAPFDPFEISTAGALCVGEPVTFTVSAFGDASSYEWTFTAGWTIIEGQGTATITVLSDVLSSGSVSVSAVNTCGTSAPIALNFSLNNPPVADLGPDFFACTGDQVILFANPPGATYLWQDGSTNVSFAANAPGVYSVEVTVNGCSDSDSVTVVWQPVPTVDLGPDQVVCPGTSVVLNAEFPGATYLWSPGGETAASITITPTDTVLVSVIVYAPNGCQTYDDVILNTDPCLGIDAPIADAERLWPVPVMRGGTLFVTGLGLNELQRIIGSDGREWPLTARFTSAGSSIDVANLPAGSFMLRTRDGRALHFTVID